MKHKKLDKPQIYSHIEQRSVDERLDSGEKLNRKDYIIQHSVVCFRS